jgi:hypothetical protein
MYFNISNGDLIILSVLDYLTKSSDLSTARTFEPALGDLEKGLKILQNPHTQLIIAHLSCYG